MDTLTSILLSNSQLPQELQQGRLAPFLELGCIPQAAAGNAQAGQDNREEAGWQHSFNHMPVHLLPFGFQRAAAPQMRGDPAHARATCAYL
jgi:hypothetical protein